MQDPFSTTAELARQRSQGIEKGFATLGAGAMQAAQGMQTQQMLKQFGILTEKEQPYTIDEIKDLAQKKFGTEININSTMPKEQQTEVAMKLLNGMGIKLPKRTTPEINLDRAASLGMSYKPDAFGGEATFAPKKETNFFEDLIKAKSAQEAGFEYKGGKVQSKGAGGFGAAQIAFAEKNAPYIAEQMKRGEVGGYERSTAQTRTAVAGLLGQEGINIDDLLLGYKSEQSSMANAKIQDQKVNNAISAQTLLDASYDPKTGEYKVPPSMHVELALSVARMLSQTGVVPYDMVQELRQTTAREGLAGAAIWMGFDPKEVGGSTQSVINLFAKTIEREGLASEKMRDKYATGKRSSFKEMKQSGKTMTDTAGLTGGAKERTATNQKTGQKMIYRGGKWTNL